MLRDLFAGEHERDVWLEDPVLLNELVMKKLQAAAGELATRWKWAEAVLDADWQTTARFGRVRPEPGELTDDEKAEIERLRVRHDELANLDDDEWTKALAEEADRIDARIDEIEDQTEARATFRPEEFAIAGCIATIGHGGALQIIQGLVKPEAMPKNTGDGAGIQSDVSGNGVAGPIGGPSVSAPIAPPPDPKCLNHNIIK